MGKRLPDSTSWMLNQLGNRINKAIQDGIDKGKDINNKKFDTLSKKTSIPQRKALGQGTKPLKITRNMAETKKIPATKRHLRFLIKMNAKKGKNTRKVQYGAYHNVGYVNKSSSRYPGTVVPKREWFGINKKFRPGQPEMNKLMITYKKLLVEISKV
tara:strand:- start:2410 stop:2880 length:471 start_codon:yes stop_codon:yes gene_type:complete